jgi:hypothetical protein
MLLTQVPFWPQTFSIPEDMVRCGKAMAKVVKKWNAQKVKGREQCPVWIVKPVVKNTAEGSVNPLCCLAFPSLSLASACVRTLLDRVAAGKFARPFCFIAQP